MTEQETLERIRELEATSRRLEPPRAARDRVDAAVIEYGEGFVDRLPGLKTYEIDRTGVQRLRAAPLSEEPAEIDELLALLESALVEPGLNPAAPGHLAYIPGGGIYYSALGDYLAAVTNRYAGVRFAGPGAVEMEDLLLDWMAGLVGYPEGAGGNLASGGSIANLIGIVTARDARGLRARDYHRAVVYLTGQAHHCIEKALRVAGLGEAVQRKVPMDERYRMVPAELERLIHEDRDAGLIPWLVIAAAGTTDVGAIDPLQEIGWIARDHELWYHIDAAYGGFFALVDECRPRLAGMELSDSIVVDPHKGLFLPYGTGAVVVKDRGALRRAHAYQAAYLQDAEAGGAAGESPAELSPELTKHFRGLRAWLPLKMHGLTPFRACLEEKLLLARYFHEHVQRLGFEVGPEPELSVATYRWVPKTGDANAFNAALIDAIHRDGRVFISSTQLDGVFWLRFAALTFRTHLDTVDLLLEILEEKVGELLS
ncbi:MAG: amino acid decarboxylase [Gemmatimonadetes bacterium]|uniref:Amino acid decarboxylase n=1 Tax=Candidatus Kutchimonas denitrificans TaxID=3056748 RepID=A0AAE4Z9Z0_9BACT|nr:amino acid decarboxylase [Gemmatimonadota bacterium]NIR76505.1 amino acid decarboxylase [Candidatus Kutchimonas denitrificans]NIS03323.1 amino acid decarboxylase [Gemmatimonadota bacterium]NIT69184.1 amino acid decarboxylase [Gemmatimonadota bacterium]NIU54576.1 amino acid decarboxylase [Gemmatimonadota bacterium]